MRKTPQELRDYMAAHPGISITRAANNLRRHGVTAPELRAALSGKEPGGSDAVVVRTTSQKWGSPLASLLDQYDEIKKVRQAMKLLPKDSFADDDEMRRQLNINFDRWKAVVQHPQVAHFRFALPKGRHVWMHPEAQAKLTSAINLDSQ